MPYETNKDLPKEISSGLSEDVLDIVRGIVCSAVYDDELSKADAIEVAKSSLEQAGYKLVTQGSNSVWEKDSTDTLIKEDLLKINEEKRLVFGWAQVVTAKSGQVILDRESDFIDDSEVLEDTAYNYVLNSRVGGEMHISTDVATLVESMVFTQEKMELMGIAKGALPIAWWVGFYVEDDEVWDKVKKRKYGGFSVGGYAIREDAVIEDPSIG